MHTARLQGASCAASLLVSVWVQAGCKSPSAAETQNEPVATSAAALSVDSGTDGGPASPSIGSFALYATEAIELNSGSLVTGCNVGVENNTGPFLAGGAAAYLSSGATIQSSQMLYAYSTYLNNGASVGPIDTASVLGNSSAKHGAIASFPAMPSPPPMPSVSAGTAAVTLNSGATKTLAAGAYASVTVNTGAKLALTGGAYVFSSLTLNSGATLSVSAPTTLSVTGVANFDSGSFVGPATGSGLTAKALVMYFGASSGISLNSAAQVQALFVATKALVTINTSKFTGALAAAQVVMNSGATITCQDGFGSLAAGCSGSCDDGNPCTTDACSSGACTHTAVPNGAACTGTNLCEQTYSCQSGACTGSSPVNCTASDACHVAGTCDPSTGACSNPTAANGTACSDGNACTQTDTCQAGTCTGSNPITCMASDPCHIAGSCDSTTGACSNPPVADGTACTDGNACTTADACKAGACVGGPPVTCTADPCHTGACNTATGACVMTAECQNLPPDPSTVAPPLDRSVATNVFEATSFLYSGANPIQTGVDPATIDPIRVAVLRGRVLTRDGSALAGVSITVLRHPEFGATRTRSDGAFDLVVNGGGATTLVYQRSGYLSVQRQLDARAQDYTVARDVVMIPYDAQVTPVPLGSADFQVARGSAVSDTDGTRQATVIFPPGETASITHSDGTVEELGTMSFRATEYTVGSTGPAAMPADLPMTTMYTYAAELSADEAVERGVRVAGTDVRLGQPVSFYVENFLGFPVGTPVPVGYYDSDADEWIPEASGVVLAVVGVTAGVAEIDLNGDGVAEDAAALDAIGLSTGEQEVLATLYSPGATLWRTQAAHLSTRDWNFPHGPPGDARYIHGDVQRQDDTDCQTNVGGSIIGCENQTLGEAIDVPGTPFDLTYESDRVEGRTAGWQITIPVTDDSPPASLVDIRVEVYVAGRMFSFLAGTQGCTIAGSTGNSPTPGPIFGEVGLCAPQGPDGRYAPNQTMTFTWDGYDAYGRRPQGKIGGSVRIGWEFPFVYGSSVSFGGPSGNGSTGGGAVAVEASPQRGIWVLWRTQNVAEFESWDDRPVGLGGWRLSAHHQYDPEGRQLHYGFGGQRTVSGATMQPVPYASVGSVAQMALMADGSLLASSWSGATPHMVVRVRTEGTVVPFAGGGSVDPLTGPVAATDANLAGAIRGIAVAPDGSAYLGGIEDHRLYRVAPDGTLTIVAGKSTDPSVYGCDGSHATQGPADTTFVGPQEIAVSKGGVVYMASYDCGVQMLTPDGQVTQLGSNIARPNHIAIAPDDSIYVSSSVMSQVFLIDGSGQATRVAGADPATQLCDVNHSGGDFGPATLACIPGIAGIALDADGALYVNSFPFGQHLLRRVKDSIVTTFVDNFTSDGSGSPGGDPLFLPSGEFFFSSQATTIEKMTAPLPSLTWATGAIASEDGRLLYTFDREGRHQETLDAFTGVPRYQISYDAAGRIAAIADGDGNTTQVQRDAQGGPSAIISPDGQQTALHVGADGYLTSITKPAGETTTMAYASGGLLTTLTDARGGVHTFGYDNLGRLVSDSDPLGAQQTLSRTELPISSDRARGHTTTLTSPMQRPTQNSVEVLESDALRRTSTDPAGQSDVSTTDVTGNETRTLADGTSIQIQRAPDPRWGDQASYEAQTTVQTPGGLVAITSLQRTANLSNPTDRLSLTSYTETSAFNGNTTTLGYAPTTRTFTTTSPAGRKRTMSLDALGHVVAESVGALEPVQMTYDSRGRLVGTSQGTGVAQRTTALAYDSNGWLQQVTDPLGRTTSFARDADGREVQRTLSDGRVVGITYDAAGNVTSVTPPGRPQHAFNYTPVDLMATYAPPPLADVPSPQTLYAYDNDRELTSVTRPDGLVIGFGYDAAARISAASLPGGNGLPAEGLSYAYDSTTGHLASVSHSDGIGLAYQYDGPLVTQETVTGLRPTAVVLSRGFDNNFHLVSEKIDGANEADFGYDADGLLTQAGQMALSRDAQNGLLTGTTLGAVADSWAYNTFGEPLTYIASVNAAEVFHTDFTRDVLGRIATKVETIQGQTTTWGYAYDAAGRLTDVTQNGAFWSHYEYDPNGNRTLASVTAPTAATLNATYDAQDRLLTYGSATYAYTANGELQSKTENGQATTYSYDVAGNLRIVLLPDGTKIEYLVDARGRRVGKKVNGALVQAFVYGSQLAPVAELDGTGNVVSRFVYGTKPNVPEYMLKGAATYRILTDHLGSPRLVIDVGSGIVAQRVDYDEWGNVVTDTNPGFQIFGFAGGLSDTDMKLVRLGERDYDTVLGQWTSKDRNTFLGRQFNQFGYSLDDPLNFIDRDGRFPVAAVAVLVVAIALADIALPAAVTFYDWYRERRPYSGPMPAYCELRQRDPAPSNQPEIRPIPPREVFLPPLIQPGGTYGYWQYQSRREEEPDEPDSEPEGWLE